MYSTSAQGPGPHLSRPCFRGPLPRSTLHPSLPELLIAHGDTYPVACPARNAYPLLLPLSQLLELSGCAQSCLHSLNPSLPHVLEGQGFSGRGPAWLLVHRVSPTPTAHYIPVEGAGCKHQLLARTLREEDEKDQRVCRPRPPSGMSICPRTTQTGSSLELLSVPHLGCCVAYSMGLHETM